jgi:hypothetical protein
VYDRAVPDPPVRPPRSETREVTELRAIKARHPELAGAVDMHIELLELQRRIQGRVPLPPLELDANIMQRHQLEGRPLLRFEHIPLDLTDLRLMVRQTADVLHRFDALDASEFQLAHALGRGNQLLEVAGRWYRRAAERAAAATGAAVVGVPAGADNEPEIVGTCWRWPCAPSCSDAPRCCSGVRNWQHGRTPTARSAAASRIWRRSTRRAIATSSAGAACCSGVSIP